MTTCLLHPCFSSDHPQILWQRDPVYTLSAACDCACAASAALHQLTEPDIDRQAAAQFSLPPDLRQQSLSASHQIAYVPGRATRLAVLNASAWNLLNNFDQPKCHQWGRPVVDAAVTDFLRLGLLVSADRDAAISSPPVEEPDILSAWLHVTDRCNLRCAYCYLPHTPADMSLETGKRAIDAIFRSARKHGYRQVKVKYAGGEPLLRFPLVLALHRYAKALADQTQILLDGIVLSNGTLLTEAMIADLKAAQLRLMISLDDMADQTGSQRCYADGRPSSQEAAAAIERAAGAGLLPEISITVSGENIDGLPRLLTWILERELPFGLNFYREHDGCAGRQALRLDQNRIITGMLAAYRTIEANLPRYSLLASLLDRANLAVPHQRPCSAGHDYLVVDCQGRIAPCQMLIDQPLTSIQAEDPLERLRSGSKGFQNLPVDQKAICDACQWRYWCAGGCPLATYRASGRYETRSPFCEIYQTLFPEVIRLEGLRLLRYQEDGSPTRLYK